MSSWRRGLACAVLLPGLAWGEGSAAQEAAPLPQLLPGGADVAFDVVGISAGMPCNEALRLAGANVNNARVAPRNRQAKINGEPALVAVQGFEARSPQSDGSGAVVRVECTSTAGEQVYLVEREVRIAGKAGWNAAELLSGLQAKYGFLSIDLVKDRERVLGVFFNASGQIRRADEECGRFRFNTPDGAMAVRAANIDINACSYALYIIYGMAHDNPNMINAIKIRIFDYLRFAKARDLLAQKAPEFLPIAPRQ